MLSATRRVTGVINGGAGVGNTLDDSAYTAPLTTDLQTATTTGATSGYAVANRDNGWDCLRGGESSS